MTELEAIEPSYLALMGKLHRPIPDGLPTKPLWNSGHHVEFRDGKFRFIISGDRGEYLEVKETTQAEELLGWIAIEEAAWLATQRLNRLGKSLKGDDGRLAWLKCNIEILEAVDLNLALRREAELRKLYRKQLGNRWFRDTNR